MRGFTLIEMLIVIAMIFVVGAFAFPLTISFLEAQVLDETTSDVTSAFRRAQAQAVFGKHANSFGVKILSNQYLIFEGSSYILRIQSEDESFSIPSRLSVTGLSEVVFDKGTGVPSATGTVNFSVLEE